MNLFSSKYYKYFTNPHLFQVVLYNYSEVWGVVVQISWGTVFTQKTVIFTLPFLIRSQVLLFHISYLCWHCSKRRRSQVMYILRILQNFCTYLWDKTLISVVRIKVLLAKWLRKKLPLFIVSIASPRHFRTYNIETWRVCFLSDNFSVTFFGVSLF